MDFSTSVTPASSESPTTEIDTWRLEYVSATAVQLAMLGGTGTSARGRITINAQVYTYSSAPQLTNGSMSASTLYYIYAYYTGGAVTLEFSTTAPNSETPGIYTFKTGDGTRRYVGKVRTNASSQFDTDAVWSTHKRIYVTQDNSCELRLSLSSTEPETTADVTNGTILYLHPYTGNRISLKRTNSDASEWEDLWISAPVQYDISAASLAGNSLYDVFAYSTGSKVRIETLAWTSAGAGTSARATALTRYDGILCKNADRTRRYLGTFMTNSGGTNTDDTVLARKLWNFYHRVPRSLYKDTGSTAYGTGAWRQFGGSAANKVVFVLGIAQQCSASAWALFRVGANTGRIAFGFNTVAANSGGVFLETALTANTGKSVNGVVIAPVGYNELNLVEYGNAAGMTTDASGIMGMIHG